MVVMVVEMAVMGVVEEMVEKEVGLAEMEVEAEGWEGLEVEAEGLVGLESPAMCAVESSHCEGDGADLTAKDGDDEAAGQVRGAKVRSDVRARKERERTRCQTSKARASRLFFFSRPR